MKALRTNLSFLWYMFFVMSTAVAAGGAGAGAPRSQEAKAVKEYLFCQQASATCYIVPVLNLARLELAIENWGADFIDKAPASAWKSHLEWWPHETRAAFGWYSTFQKIMNPRPYSLETDSQPFYEYPAAREYLINGVKNAPSYPNYYEKSEDGSVTNMLKTDEEPLRGHQYPYFFVDQEGVLSEGLQDYGKLSTNSLRVPFDLCQDAETGDNQLRVFNAVFSRWERFTIPADALKRVGACYSLTLEQCGAIQNQHKLPEETQNRSSSHVFALDQLGYHYLTPQTELIFIAEKPLSILGCESVGAIPWLFPGFTMSKDDAQERFAACFRPGDYLCSFNLYELGIYKLMLLVLGLDERHETIEPFDDLGAVVSELRNAFRQGGSRTGFAGSWDVGKLFSPEKLIEVQLATIFKENRELFRAMKEVVDIRPLQGWKFYEHFRDHCLSTGDEDYVTPIYRDPGCTLRYSLEEARNYLPGPEQALAYFVMQNIRFLWYGSLSEKTFFQESLDLEEAEELGIKDWSFAMFKENAQRFLEQWAKVKEELKKLKRRHFVSFSGHGFIVSLDDVLIGLEHENLQRTGRAEYADFLRDELGCVGIESYMSSDLMPFYARKRVKRAKNEGLSKAQRSRLRQMIERKKAAGSVESAGG